MPEATYSKKALRATITLQTGGSNQYVFEGFAMEATVAKTGGTEFAKANLTIYGLSVETMAQLTWCTFKPLSRGYNLLQIEAGEQGSRLSLIFRGEITSSYADLNGASPALKIEAQTGSYPILIPEAPIAIQGQQSVEQFVRQEAAAAGYEIENHGVDAQLKDCVISGDPITKIRSVADAAGADVLFDDGKVVLVPRDKPRKAEGGIPVISAETGMIGYPTFTSQGLQVRSFFRPDLTIGAEVRVESIVPQATGVWKITQLSHELSANNPGRAAWRTNFSGLWLND